METGLECAASSFHCQLVCQHVVTHSSTLMFTLVNKTHILLELIISDVVVVVVLS